MGKEDAMETHILNFYEDLDMSFRELLVVSSDIVNNNIQVQEKMDGQNLTFTVKDGELKIFGKRLDRKIIESRGATWKTIDENYSEITREGFKSAYFVLEQHLSTFSQEDIDNIFQNGKIVIESAMITPLVPVTIRYSSNYIRFIRPFSPYGLDVSSSLVTESFSKITSVERFYIDHKERTWSVGPVPVLKNIATQKERAGTTRNIKKSIVSLINEHGENLTIESTLGEYATIAVEDYIRKNHKNIPNEIRKNVAKRISEKAKKEFTVSHIKNIFPDSYKEIWEEVKLIEKNEILVLASSISRLENTIQKIGSLVFDCLKFELAKDFTQIDDLQNSVKEIVSAKSNHAIKVINTANGDIEELSDKWSMKLEVGIERASEIHLLRKPVEGIVFMADIDNRKVRRKLTGMFTAIHRLTGLFKFTTGNKKLIVI